MYKLLWKTERGLVLSAIASIPISLVLSAIAMYTPAVVLSVLEMSQQFSYIALVIVGLLIIKLVFDLMQNIISAKVEYARNRTYHQMTYMWQCKRRDRDWNHEFNLETQKSDERCKNAIGEPNRAGKDFPLNFAKIISAILNFILFGSVISLLNPSIILLLVFGCTLNYFASKWRRQRNIDDGDLRNDLVKKLNYSTRDIAINFKYAKDLRLYNMEKPLLKRLKRIFAKNQEAYKKLESRNVIVSIVCEFHKPEGCLNSVQSR